MSAATAAAGATAVGLLALASSLAVAAEDKKEDTGVPDGSIATSLPAELADPGGVRRALADYGITLGASYTADVFGNTIGGLKQGTQFMGLANVAMDVDFGKLTGWTGLTLHANGYRIDGTSIQRVDLGSLAPVSSVEAFPSTRLDELFLEQKLLNNTLSIKAGEIVSDTEFFVSDIGGKFVSGTFGWATIVSDNIPFGGPAYPFAAPGARVSVSPDDHLKLLAGVWDGNPVGTCPPEKDPGQCNTDGLDFPLGDPLLFMGEGQYAYGKEKGGLPGTIRLGGWRHNGDFDDLRRDDAGGLLGVSLGTPLSHKGNYGLYGIIDQMIYRLPGEGDEAKGISVFARVSGSPADRNQIDFYADTGFIFTGMVPGRPDDFFGAAFAYTRISDKAAAFDRDSGSPVIRDFEANLEITYSAQIVQGLTIQPDFQYFWHPGGNVPLDPLDPESKAVKDAAVFGARTNLSY